MKLTSGWIGGSLSLGMSIAVRTWMKTLRFQISYYDSSYDPANASYTTPGIYIFWHEYIPFMFYLRGHNDVAMLLSQHRDAETLARATRFVGFGTIRGSTSRGGITALRKMFRQGKTMNLTMTPDGPRGPRRELAAGCVYLASRLQLPIIPLGLGYDRPWRMRRAWDQFAVPRPGSRARAIMGPGIWIPAKADRDQLETHRRQVETVLNRLTVEAEQWAETGQAVGNPVVITRTPRALTWMRGSAEPAIAKLDDASRRGVAT
ncbi:hypothetical protein CA51_33580 [Rosistilla oblonga]|uniref:lysophospholipid acyltransferase family protein n=1 Tax=Rosistilla oblonga TaxID=2527990 RepID=UPI001189B936|nr:lysophospholipid acyltransferase family protein [Rosistilla oblonga]QDV13468.1 hypothetical protein CA51_33580 [Rosistilla oblonga]